MIKKIKGRLKNLRKAYGRMLFRMSGRENENNDRLLELRGKYNGKRCFVVCNGPSLKAADLDVIHKNGEVSFASNKIDKIFAQTEWRPTFYSVIDEYYQYTLSDTMNRVPAEIKFFRKDSYSVTRKVKGSSIWLTTDGDRGLLDAPKFTADCTGTVYTIATVTFVLIELAVHMGFKEIYIIGCDNSYGIERKKDGTIVSTGKDSYFAGSTKEDNKAVGSPWEADIAYKCAREYADRHGIRIINATRGGHLEIFERTDFDTLF